MALMPLILYRDSYNAWLLLLFTKPEYRPVIVCVCRIQQHNAGTSHFGNGSGAVSYTRTLAREHHCVCIPVEARGTVK